MTAGHDSHPGIVPRYHFHLYDDMDVPDDEGREFPNLEAARDRASFEARALFAAMAEDQGRVVLAHRIDVEDEQGLTLATVRFGDVVKIEP
jgi:hypothetical protein